MKIENVKCHEVVDGTKRFVAEGPLQLAESLEDIILMTESGECVEKDLVTHFNASRRIEKQRQLKSGDSTKVNAKTTLAKLIAEAAKDEALADKMRALGIKL